MCIILLPTAVTLRQLEINVKAVKTAKRKEDYLRS